MNCLYITLFFNIVAGIVQTFIKSFNQLLYPGVIEVCRQPVEPRHDFFLHLIIVVELFPARCFFSWRNKWKSLGSRSGLYGGWSNISHLNFSRSAVVRCAEWGRALSWSRHTPSDNILLLLIIFFNCNWVVTRWQWLFYTYTNIKRKVTRKFKSGGLHERHVAATWKLGNHLSIRL